MALSNWDTLAVDLTSRSTEGVLVSPLGVRVEIYKNWLYVQDKKAWQEGGGYTKPTVMHVLHGCLQYKDIYITARRGPKNGVYTVVSWSKWAKKEKDRRSETMVGIGCYGYAGEEWVGVEREEVDFLRAMLDEHEVVDVRVDLPAVLASRISDEKAIYKSYTFNEKIRAIDLNQAVRFNQGDLYFAQRTGTGLAATEPGKSLPTVMSQLLEKEIEKPIKRKRKK